MMLSLVTTILVMTVCGLDAANLQRGYRRPLYRQLSSPLRGQVGLLGPSPVSRIASSISPRLPPLKKVVWVKKIDPRTGAWVKVISEKSHVISPAVRHHFAKKAHIARKMRMINTIARARNLARINNVRGGLLGFARERDGDDFYREPAGFLGQHRGRGAYRRYSRNPKITRQNVARTGSVGLLGPAIAPRSRQLNLLLNNRAPLLRRNVNLRRRFDDDGDFLEDFVENTLDNGQADFDSFGEIDDSFDDRFDRGFRDTYPLLNTRSGAVGAGVRGFQRMVPRGPTQTLNRKARNPSVRAGILGLQRKGYYTERPGIPRQNVNTVGIGGTQTGTFKSLDKLRNNINVVTLGRSNIPFRGMRGTGTAGVLGNQRISDDAIPRMINKAIAINDRISDSSFVPTPNPAGNIGATTTGAVGLAGVGRFPDGFSRSDVDDLDDLSDPFDNRLDLVKDELRHLNNRLNLNDHINMKDRINLNDKLDDLNDRLEHRLIPAGPARGIDEEIFDRPHMVTAIGGRDDAEDGGDIGILGQDQSPIDGLELLGPSTWSDIITELQGAGSHNEIFDQIPQESVPVFPVNPHTAAEPSTATGSDVTPDRNSGLVAGSLALLGIDPDTIKTQAEHPPPIPLPNKSQKIMKQNSLDSQTTTKKVSVTGSDDSTQTVFTIESSNKDTPVSSQQSPVSQTIQAPTKDIVNAARQIAALGALDNLDFGLDSFDEDLRV